MKKNNPPLTDKEKRELKIIDNPDVKFYPPLLAYLISLIFFGRYLAPLKIKYADIKKRKDRVVKLKTKMRLHELGIDPDKNYQEYYKIVKEEEKRFDERFKNIK